MNDKAEPFLWINHADMRAIGQRLGMHLYGCFIEIVMHTAETNGEISYEGAVNLLIQEPHTNDEQAKDAVDALIAAEVIRKNGTILTIVAYEKSIIPDYDGWDN